MRLKSQAATEYRFKVIINLTKEGKKQQEIANITGCDRSWVSKIQKRYQEVGELAFNVRGVSAGKMCKLSKEDLEKLKELLAMGALAHGEPTDNWTRERIKKLIENIFFISYSAAHISNIMKRIDFTSQKPIHKSYRKDETEVKEWTDKTLPSLKKS